MTTVCENQRASLLLQSDGPQQQQQQHCHGRGGVMEASCCSNMSSDDDESFCCSMGDSSCFDDDDDDESLCYDTDNDESMSITPDSNDDDDGDACDETGVDLAGKEGAGPLSPNKLSSSLLPRIVHSLCSDQEDAIGHLDLSFPIPGTLDKNDSLSRLLQAMRCNTTVTKCSISTRCFQSLPMEQRRALVDTVGGLPSLTSLVLDSVFAEFMYTNDFLRNWKRDHHYRHNEEYRAFDNQTVQDICIGQIPSTISEQVLGHLIILTVNSYSSLKSLSISFVGDGEPNAVLMRVALTAMSHSKSLEEVKFCEANLTMMEVGASRKEGVLRVLRCSNRESELDHPSYIALSQMLQVHRQSLQGLVLDASVDNNCARTMADTLNQNRNLKALCLGTFDCQDKTRRDGFLSLVSNVMARPQEQQREATPSPVSLKYLSLVCKDLDDHGVAQLSKVLSQSSNLQELMLFLDNHIHDPIGAQGMAALAQLLQVSSSMQDFSLVCNDLKDDGILEIAKALQNDNRNLKKLKLQCNRSFCLTSRGYQALIDMLKVNTFIESISLGRCSRDDEEEDEDEEMALADGAPVDEDYQAEIDFYLKLNRGGVRDLQLNTGTTPSQFLFKVVSHREDLDTVFYMLSANPSFVSIGTKTI